MSHRIQNNVGYKKIYPMSLWEDNNFCHYCGRKANIETQLEWDHVPALNVSIPEYLARDIHKTLVRSCSECNNLASDIPHMDYLERHFWLKSALLRRYKSILVNYDGKPVDTSGMLQGFLKASVKNAEVKYEEILNRIGFGIKNLDDIESPILDLKNKQHRRIRDVLVCYLHGLPTEDDDEDDEEEEQNNDYLSQNENENENDPAPYPFNDFIDFLVSECQCKKIISSDKSYKTWCNENPSRFLNLELPLIPPSKYFGKSWDSINAKVNIIIRDENLEDEAHEEAEREECERLEYEREINNDQKQPCELRKFAKAQKTQQNRHDIEMHRANKISRNKEGIIFTSKQKRDRIYKLFGDKYHIVSMTTVSVTFRCPEHGLVKRSVDDMVAGLGCRYCKK